ncbi:hypothetical protein PsalN5692_03583 (plasmid) [Piscirickettsia salmonis]|uniref:hypothetical protein n=1 Tax=Piscirickettsia salmonis TaxID=1238 RepID=UPI0012B83AE7|nr:hypothetical protein [Piscirickettsia salmonis]QGP52075.1 hypothetical protein PsalN5692_03583 [Piscirickettsia salmonis]
MTKITPKTIKNKLPKIQQQLEQGMDMKDVATEHGVSLKTLKRYIQADGQLSEAGLRLLFDF